MTTKPELRLLAFKHKEQRQQGWGRAAAGWPALSLALRLMASVKRGRESFWDVADGQVLGCR